MARSRTKPRTAACARASTSSRSTPASAEDPTLAGVLSPERPTLLLAVLEERGVHDLRHILLLFLLVDLHPELLELALPPIDPRLDFPADLAQVLRQILGVEL